MVSTKTFSNGFQSFPIQLGATNSFTSFTHGSVVYDGSNIACIGESLRLQNGNLNTNMMKQIHYLITISSIQLMEVKSDIIQPYKQTVLGHSSSGFSYSDHSTFIWSSPQPDCDLLEIMQLSMLSVSPNSFDILATLKEFGIGSFYVKTGLIYRDSILKCKLLLNSEVWHSLTLQQISILEDVDRTYLRWILNSHPKVAIEVLHFETGTQPLKYDATTKI